jgi:predicted alpha/beta hydrolase
MTDSTDFHPSFLFGVAPRFGNLSNTRRATCYSRSLLHFSGAQVKRSNFVSWLVVNFVFMLVRAVTPVVAVHSRNQHQSDGFARPFWLVIGYPEPLDKARDWRRYNQHDQHGHDNPQRHHNGAAVGQHRHAGIVASTTAKQQGTMGMETSARQQRRYQHHDIGAKTRNEASNFGAATL